MGLKDEIFKAFGWRNETEAAMEIARSKEARAALKELAQSETARELAKELAGSETARALAKEIARETARETAKEALGAAGHKVAGAARRFTDSITSALKEQQRKLDEEWAAAERRRAEERQAREIEDELAALKKQLDDKD